MPLKSLLMTSKQNKLLQAAALMAVWAARNRRCHLFAALTIHAHVEGACLIVVAATPTQHTIASTAAMATLQVLHRHTRLHIAQCAHLEHIPEIALDTRLATIARLALTSLTLAMNTASVAQQAHINLLKVQLLVITVLPAQHHHRVQVLVTQSLVTLDPTFHQITAITAQQARSLRQVQPPAECVLQDHTAALGKRNAPHAEQARINLLKVQAFVIPVLPAQHHLRVQVLVTLSLHQARQL
jgi:hypothetical protein